MPDASDRPGFDAATPTTDASRSGMAQLVRPG